MYQETADKYQETADKYHETADKFQDTADKYQVTADKHQETADKYQETADNCKQTADAQLLYFLCSHFHCCTFFQNKACFPGKKRTHVMFFINWMIERSCVPRSEAVL